MAAGLFRLDPRGFVPDRRVEDKLVLTCRFVAVLVASIYKAKGVPCRCRAGYAPYIQPGSPLTRTACTTAWTCPLPPMTWTTASSTGRQRPG